MLRNPGGGSSSLSSSTPISGGADTQVLFNDAGFVGQDAGLVYNKTTDILTAGGLRLTNNGALSSGAGPIALVSGTWITGGTATTCKPAVLIEANSGVTTSTGWSTSGTGLGVNAASGFVGDYVMLQLAGVPGIALSKQDSGGNTNVVTFYTAGVGRGGIGGASGISSSSGLVIRSASGTQDTIGFNTTNRIICITNVGEFGWGGLDSAANDVRLFRDAAGIMGLRDGTTRGQIFRVYHDADGSPGTNYARAFIDAGVATGNTLTFGSEKGGSPAAAMTKFQLNVDGTNKLDYNVTTAGGWTSSTAITIGGGAQLIFATAGSSIQWAGPALLDAPAASTIRVTRGSDQNCKFWVDSLASHDTNFQRIVMDWSLNSTWGTIGTTQGGTGLSRSVCFVSAGGIWAFAGITSSFPAISRSTTNLALTLADGTGNAGLAIGPLAAVGSQHSIVVRKTGIADNSATAVITVTVPNAAHNAAIFLDILAHCGTGTDASESSRCATGCILLARTSGVDTVATAATLTTTQIATVSGGGTITLAYGVSAISGANSATQTFTITLTIVVTGTITDHTAVVSARLLNSLATGVTIAAA